MQRRTEACNAGRLLALCLLAFTIGCQATASAAELSATTSTLSSVFASAQAGDTILLASGDYGRFSGGMKPGMVTLKPQPGATPRIKLYFSPAQNITIDGLTIDDAVIGNSATKHIVVRNADIPGQTVIHTDEIADADILFDHNVHRDWDKCSDCYEGRLELPGSDNQAIAGVTIQNSEFKGGVSDGIQNGGRGVKILNNNFHDLAIGTPDGVHTDAIQLYGSRETVIRGNYFHDTGSKIGAFDGADHEVIEDNVFAGDGTPYAIVLFSDVGSIVRHNTLAPGPSCWFDSPCGIIRVGSKTGGCTYADSCDPGTGTVVENNILSALSFTEGKATFSSRSNLFIDDNRGGQGDKKGVPRFVSSTPKSWADYALADGSPGKGDASDGSDRGIRVGDARPPSSTLPAPSAGSSSIRVLSTLRSIRKTARLRLRLQIAGGGTATLSGTIRPRGRKLIKLGTRSLGTLAVGSRTVTLKLKRSARRSLGRAHSARLAVTLKIGATSTSAKLAIKRR